MCVLKHVFQGNYTDHLSAVTSAWPPELNVFPHFAHFRHGLCQSFPREDTFSAKTKKDEARFKHRSSHAPNPIHRDSTLDLLSLCSGLALSVQTSNPIYMIKYRLYMK